MNRTFNSVAISQFLSSLADNALLIVSIALLIEMQEPDWLSPLLKIFFVFPYVLLAPFVGAFADSRPKGQVMLICNLIKAAGCCFILTGVHPLLGYGIVGIGAALYAPAKYGILTEILPSEKLVAANGWIEGLIIGSIVFGTLLGGFLISNIVTDSLNYLDLKFLPELIHTSTLIAVYLIAFIYFLAALLNLPLLKIGYQYQALSLNCKKLVIDFSICSKKLWQDPLGRLSLTVTTLFWGAGATLQFVVLKWAESALHMSLSESAILQAVSAFGVAGGAMWAAYSVTLKQSTKVLPYGAVMGLVVCLVGIYNDDLLPQTALFQLHSLSFNLNVIPAYILLIILGWLSGYFVVPMNALLQIRGHTLMSPGQSIAVQGFNENLSVLFMLIIYAFLLWLDLNLSVIIIGFGITVFLLMMVISLRHLKYASVEPI